LIFSVNGIQYYLVQCSQLSSRHGGESYGEIYRR
jgi:hypothetical protein